MTSHDLRASPLYMKRFAKWSGRLRMSSWLGWVSWASSRPSSRSAPSRAPTGSARGQLCSYSDPDTPPRNLHIAASHSEIHHGYSDGGQCMVCATCPREADLSAVELLEQGERPLPPEVAVVGDAEAAAVAGHEVRARQTRPQHGQHSMPLHLTRSCKHLHVQFVGCRPSRATSHTGNSLYRVQLRRRVGFELDKESI